MLNLPHQTWLTFWGTVIDPCLGLKAGDCFVVDSLTVGGRCRYEQGSARGADTQQHLVGAP